MSKEITGLSPGIKYYFKGYATNALGTGYGDQSDFTTIPGNPSALSAIRTDKDEMSLTWTKGSGGTYSIIRRGETAPANINSGDLVYQGTGSACTDSTGLDPGTLYYYRVWSATTSDWSVAYSASYSASYDTTQADFVDTTDAFVDDVNPATVPTNDGILKCQVSKNGGTTWSSLSSLTFTGSITTQSFGNSTTETWGTSWVGTDVSDTNFRVKILGGSDEDSYQIFKDFGFSINASYTLTGVQVQVKAAYDSSDLLLYFIKVDVYYGESPLPVSQGSIAYDTTLERPTYYDGGEWVPIGGGSKVIASATAPADPKFGDLWIDTAGG
jgi:hypothetical protein